MIDLRRSTDLAWLAVFRMLFGAVMCTSMLRFIAYGWIDELWVKPRFHFTYWGFDWVETLSRGGMVALFWTLATLALCMAVGLCFRPAAFAFLAGFVYVQLLDVATYLNHYYLAALLALMLAVSPAGELWSVDAWRRGRVRSQAPFAWLALFRFQVAIVYTFAGLAKAHEDWLRYGHPLRIWLSSRTDMPVLGDVFAMDVTPLVMSWAGFLFDTSVAWLLMVRRWRPWAFAAVVAFHVLTRLLFPIGMFPAIMITAALVFFEPSWPRDVSRWLGLARTASPMASADFTWTRSRRVRLALAATYCALQVVLPLRFLAYGGNVRWHEQGMRFSWRVMVREKNGSVTFVVRDPSNDRRMLVSPRVYLTQLQEREMSGQPDLILQLAHRVADDYGHSLGRPVEVYAEAVASLNGRRSAPLVDPTVNLARVDDGLERASWIMPAPQTRPPHLRALRAAVASRP